MFLQEKVRPGQDRLLNTVMRAARPAWAREFAYSFSESVVLRERFQEPLACRRCFGRRPFVVAGNVARLIRYL